MAVAPRLISCRNGSHLGDPLHFLADRRAPAVEFLAERHRHGVLQVGATHLQHLPEFPALGEERLLQPGKRLHVARQPQDEREAERCRVDVVGRLPEIDVIVGVDVLVLALPVAQRLQREIGDHLVGVHVGRRSGAALDEIGDELLAHLAGDQPVAGAGDRIGDLRVEHAEIAVRQRGGLLHVAEGLDEIRLQRHRDAGDVEVLLAAQRLHAVVRVVGNFLAAEEVLFDPGCHGVAPVPGLDRQDFPRAPERRIDRAQARRG